MSDTQFKFTDRYQAAGIPYPKPDTVCLGQCVGMGCYPQYVNLEADGPFEYTSAERDAWQREHDTVHRLGFRFRMAMRFRRIRILWERCDGWHFIRCADCNGTGKRPRPTGEQDL